MSRGQADREDLLCWLPFYVNLSFFPTINLISSACHLLYYLFLHPTFTYNVLSSAAFYSQLTHSDLDSPSPAKALRGNSNPLLLSYPSFGSYVLPPCPQSSSFRGLASFWGRDYLELSSPSPLHNWAPVLANFILAALLINVTNRNSAVMSSRRD